MAFLYEMEIVSHFGGSWWLAECLNEKCRGALPGLREADDLNLMLQ